MRGNWLDGDKSPSRRRLVIPSNDAIPVSSIHVGEEGRIRGQWLEAGETDPEAERGARDQWAVPGWTGPVIAAGALACAGLVVIALTGNTNVGKALIVAPVLAWIVNTLAKRFAEKDGQPAIVPIMMAGLAVKFVGVLARYWIGLQVYGRSDATEYVKWGHDIAPGLRHFHLPDIGRLQGTNFVRLLTGIVFAVTPASAMGGYLVFGFMSFLGMLLFWRAFKIALPNFSDRVYLQVLMLMPSLAFWPSAIGKDAWLVLGVGMASYGVANILANRTLVGWLTFVAGIYAVLAVRPHVGIAVVAGLVVAELLRARGSQGAGRAALSILLLVVVGGIVMSSAAAFLGLSNWSKASVDQELAGVSNRTSEGRSEFSPTQVNSPAQFPIAAFTVLFRPMPYETHSPQELATAIEDVVLLGAAVVCAPRIVNSIRHSRRRPYLLYCLGTLTVFVIEYSTFSNFALIARQRTQVAALLLVLLCIPKSAPVEVGPPLVGASRRSQGVDALPPD
jgi:hypothetical protein